MKCPNCGLINPPSALRCDCGYEFDEHQSPSVEQHQRKIEINRQQKVRAVGLAHRLLHWAILAGFAGVFIPYALFIAIPFQLYCTYKLARALDLSTVSAVLYVVVMFVPLVSLVFLLILRRKATKFLQWEGVRVGLMGAKVSDLPAAEASGIG